MLVFCAAKNGVCVIWNKKLCLWHAKQLNGVKKARCGPSAFLFEVFLLTLYANKDSYEYRGTKNNRRRACQ